MACPKISAADYSHVVARAAPNRSYGFYLQPLRYARFLVTFKVILWRFFQWPVELDSVATNFQSTQRQIGLGDCRDVM